MTSPIERDDPSIAPEVARRNSTVAVVAAGDYIGAAIARRFARGGYTLFGGRRHGDKLAPLVSQIEAGGGVCIGRALDARQEQSVTRFLAEAKAAAPLEIAVFNIGANVNSPIRETTERVFHKIRELACYAGFLTGQEAARHMVLRSGGSIFFTGATANLRGAGDYAAFASAKFGLRTVAQRMARELGPKEHPCRASGDRRRCRHRMGARAHPSAIRRGCRATGTGSASEP